MPTIVTGWVPTTLDHVRQALDGASPEQGATVLSALAELAEATLARTIEAGFSLRPYVRPLNDSRCIVLRDMLHERRQWVQAWDLEHDSDDYTTVDYHHCPTYVNL